MPEFDADRQLDDALRNVPVPAGLSSRLSELASWPDGELAADLQAISLPDTLQARLRAIPANESLAGAINQVDVPDSLREKLFIVPQTTPRFPSVRPNYLGRFHTALLATSLALLYAIFSWHTLSDIRRPRQQESASATFLWSEHPQLISLPDQQLIVTWSPAGSEDSDVSEGEIPSPEPIPLEVPLAPALANRTTPPETVPAPARNDFNTLMRGFREYVLGAPPLGARDVLELETVNLPVPRGMAAPLIPGYDRAFLLRTGVHPPVSPRNHELLQQCLAPLAMETRSFDQALFQIAQRKMPRGEDIHPEDFLAALRSGLSSPANGTAVLEVGHAPSIFGPAGSHWLGVQVRTGPTRERTTRGTHLVVVVDLSPELLRRGTLAWLRAGLEELLERGDENDRLTVIAVQHHVLYRVNGLGKRDGRQLQTGWPDKLSFTPGDPRRAWQAGLEAVTELDASSPVQLVFATAGSAACPPDLAGWLREFNPLLAGKKLGVSVVDVGIEPSLSPGVDSMAQAIGGDARKLRERRKWLHFLQQKLSGDAAVTAREAQTLVRFNPATVAAYRLVGHESNALGDLLPASTVVDLYPGDESHVLFEFLPAAGKGDWLAEVELSWVDPALGQTIHSRKKILKSQLTGTWENSSFWMRQAVVAAETAESLRGSRLTLRKAEWSSQPASLAELLSRARQLQGRTGTSRSATELQRLLEGLVRLEER